MLLLLVAALVALAVAWWLFRRPPVSLVYRTATIDRGDIASYVVSTGILNPVTMVEVGPQVSGVIKAVAVDFNTRVKKGAVLAEIDPAPFSAQVKQAEAIVKKVVEEVKAAQKVFDENTALYDKRLISQEEYDDSKAKLATSRAALEQAEATLDMAHLTLGLSTIRAPMDGVVVSRRATVGQTVAANVQASPLFLIADRLAKMTLEASVNEADIGKVKEGQQTSFTVDAYPEQIFNGVVWQVRNVPTVVQNIVTYQVILRVDNKALQLKPGMTANVRILVASRHDVRRVPREALRFLPPPLARIDDTVKPVNGASVVWTRRQDGRLKAMSIRVGISDESYAELLDDGLKDGDEVIVEAMEQGKAASDLLGPSVLPQPKRF